VSERLLTAADLAEVLGFAAGTIVDWAEKGTIPAFKVGGRLRFREREVLEWLEAQRVGPRPSNGPAAGGDLLPTPTAEPTRRIFSQALPTPERGGGSAS
jgi:excisionase family DNA binding protein